MVTCNTFELECKKGRLTNANRPPRITPPQAQLETIMPKFGHIDLPVVTLGGGDPDAIAAKLTTSNMPVEAMVEVLIYCKREREKADALSVIEDVLRGRILAAYETMPPEKRETTRTEVGMVTYTAAGETVSIVDRDTVVESLTQEQLRITYKPDMAALKTILKPDAYERLIKRTPKKASITVRDNPGASGYTEIDF